MANKTIQCNIKVEIPVNKRGTRTVPGQASEVMLNYWSGGNKERCYVKAIVGTDKIDLGYVGEHSGAWEEKMAWSNAGDECKKRVRVTCKEMVREERSIASMIGKARCIASSLDTLFDKKKAPVKALHDEGKITHDELRDRINEFREILDDKYVVDSRIASLIQDDDKSRGGKSREEYLKELVDIGKKHGVECE